MKTVRKTIVGVAVCMAAVAGLGGAAHAAPTLDNAQGQTERGNGRSECHFSGLNDDPFEAGAGGRVQSFGQIVKVAGPMGGVPGVACNPIRSAGLG